MKRILILTLTVIVGLFAASASAEGFDVLALGARGGIQGGNLSAYMIHPDGDQRSVTCDAGAIVNGLIKAEELGNLDYLDIPDETEFTRVGYSFTHIIKGYLISHAHLDHLAGMIIGAPDDSKKPIYSLQSTLTNIEKTYFNWIAWPNFGTTGIEPRLSKYAYIALPPGVSVSIADTAMKVTAFPLAHGPVEAAAFLIESGQDAILCFGDTGPDSVQKTDNLDKIWRSVADKAASGDLKAIIIESSFASDRPDKFLFGHLTPKYILQELNSLAAYAGGQGSIKNLPVVISHIKYSLKTG